MLDGLLHHGADLAIERLCQRYRSLASTGKALPKVITAIARELVGFIWDIGRRLRPA